MTRTTCAPWTSAGTVALQPDGAARFEDVAADRGQRLELPAVVGAADEPVAVHRGGAARHDDTLDQHVPAYPADDPAHCVPSRAPSRTRSSLRGGRPARLRRTTRCAREDRLPG